MKDGSEKEYHACASAAGIEAMDGTFSGGPYSGTWYCAGAFDNFKSIYIMAGLLSSMAIINFMWINISLQNIRKIGTYNMNKDKKFTNIYTNYSQLFKK